MAATSGATNGTASTITSNDTGSGDGTASSADRAQARDQSIPELIRHAIDTTQLLIAQELALFKAQLQQTAAGMGRGVGLAVVGGVFTLLGLALLGITLIFVFRLFLADWLAALIVTLIYFVIGGVLAFLGVKSLQEASKKPAVAVGQVQEDAAWIGRQIK